VDSTAFAATLREIRARRGISQLELATRARTTQRHVSFVESGRSAPGRQMVARLAESLELSPRESNELLLSAGYAAVHPETDLADPALRPVLAALRHVLAGHLPYPAIVIGPYGDLVDANTAFGVMTDGVAPALLRPPVNVYRLALHPDGMAPRIGNLADWSRHILDRMRRRADPKLAVLLAELTGYLPDPAPRADEPVLGFAVPLELRHPDGRLNLITTVTTFATAVDVTIAELRLEAFLPADETTKTILSQRYGG
jgi:transcriptional regulator with XRE-family HTH domain